MFRFKYLSVMLIACLCLPAIAGAQDEEATTFIYATYFECDTSREWRADEIASSVMAPAYDAAVEEGIITSWGWLAHHTGAKWRRVLYYTAPSVDGLFAAPAAISEKISEKKGASQREFGEICGRHDDYIWQSGMSSAGAGVIAEERGKAGMSVYMKCDMSREERADEIIEEVFAPIQNALVANGSLTSWGWIKHYVGGKWRRAALSTAKDRTSLLAARTALIQKLGAEHEAAAKEFNDICGDHQDYLWDILHETP